MVTVNPPMTKGTVSSKPAHDVRPSSWSRYREAAYGALAIVTWLSSWQISASLGLVNENFTSSPLGAFRALGVYVSTGSIWPPLGSTLATVGWGLGISLALGIPLGLLIGRSKLLHGLTEPPISIMYSVPFVVFLPIIIFWFGIDSTARIVIVVWAAVFPLLINVVAGARNVDQNYLQVAHVFCTSRIRTLWSVVLPATLPYILAGVRQAVGRALVGAIVAELFMGGKGLGYVVQTETSNFQMDSAMAAIFIIALLAVLFTRTVAYAERRFTFWSTSN